MPTRFLNPTLVTPLIVLLCSCAATNGATGGNSPAVAGDTTFRNFLVVAIADDYTNRAHFERTVVSHLQSKGASATAYYIAAGGNKPVSRESIRAAISEASFDAVLVSRVVNTTSDIDRRSRSPGATSTRMSGGPLDLFRYEYEEIEDPGSFDIEMDATVAAELYRVADETLVWSTTLTEKNANNVGALIDDVAEALVRRVERAKLIGK